MRTPDPGSWILDSVYWLVLDLWDKEKTGRGTAIVMQGRRDGATDEKEGKRIAILSIAGGVGAESDEMHSLDCTVESECCGAGEYYLLVRVQESKANLAKHKSADMCSQG